MYNLQISLESLKCVFSFAGIKRNNPHRKAKLLKDRVSPHCTSKSNKCLNFPILLELFNNNELFNIQRHALFNVQKKEPGSLLNKQNKFVLQLEYPLQSPT